MDGDRIVDFGKNIKVGAAECIDAQGMYTGPGLIDIHTHACDNVFFFEDPARASAASLYNAAVQNTKGLLIIIPLLIVYLFCQRYLVEGIERSGLVG